VYSYSPIFFVLYLIVTLYIIANVVRICSTLSSTLTQLIIMLYVVTNSAMAFTVQILAVIYSNFSDAAKQKFKRLFLHKR